MKKSSTNHERKRSSSAISDQPSASNNHYPTCTNHQSTTNRRTANGNQHSIISSKQPSNFCSTVIYKICTITILINQQSTVVQYGVGGEFGWVRTLVVCFLHKANPNQPTKTYLLFEKSGPIATFNLILLGLGWPWVGEFDGFIIIVVCFPTRHNLVHCKHPNNEASTINLQAIIHQSSTINSQRSFKTINEHAPINMPDRQTDNKLYLVLDYCPGGELFFHLSRYKRFPEGVVRFYAAELVLALKV